MKLTDKNERTPDGNHKNDKRIYTMNRSAPLTLIVFLTLAFILGSCEAIAGIFKAGMGFGIFLVVAVLIAIVVLVMRMNRNKNS